ncbi:hypothetical protein [Kitasatospora sp. McL0602]|uniref:hypothetical protein n=1 Tax=Kitasatospora sp. McL0602 TaxID=3439530 RepID=UPI003F88BACA
MPVAESNPESDYRDQIANYSAMGIPLCLIVEPGRGTAHAMSEPDGTARLGSELPGGHVGVVPRQ